MNEAKDPSPTVLVVEDEALVAMLLEDVLAEAGYRPVWTPDGRHAARSGAWPADEAPRAAVVDLGLAGGADGRDVIRRLRKEQPGMPAVVVTGYNPQAPQADLRGLGGPTVRLGKPVDSEALLENLARVLNLSPTPAAPQRRTSDMEAA